MLSTIDRNFSRRECPPFNVRGATAAPGPVLHLEQTSKPFRKLQTLPQRTLDLPDTRTDRISLQALGGSAITDVKAERAPFARSLCGDARARVPAAFVLVDFHDDILDCHRLALPLLAQTAQSNEIANLNFLQNPISGTRQGVPRHFVGRALHSPVHGVDRQRLPGVVLGPPRADVGKVRDITLFRSLGSGGLHRRSAVQQLPYRSITANVALHANVQANIRTSKLALTSAAEGALMFLMPEIPP